MVTSSIAGTASPLLAEARAAWRQRTVTEYRSSQIFARFLTEVLAAGDDHTVHERVLEMVKEELEHVQLCETVCRHLGVDAPMPSPESLKEPAQFSSAPAQERALHTAITMLLINETLSVGFIEDLHARCTNPPIQRVLAATLGDEAQHERFGFEYVQRALRRYSESARRDFRHLVALTLQGHLAQAEQVLSRVPANKQTLEAWPDYERVKLGLFSPERQALVFQKTLTTKLLPILAKLDLVPDTLRGAQS